jgi:hypothetical protein
MMTLVRSHERGHANHGWLDSFHTFSFADYYNPRRMGYRSLRVINEDRVEAGMGFPTHPHANMEIISYVLDGGLEHKDSMGTGSIIRPGDVQRMSAGTGVTHSEYNASPTDEVHFLQIWLVPAQRGLAPSYEQEHFAADDKRGALRVIASPDGRDGSVTVHQDVALYATLLDAGQAVRHALRAGRGAWVHVARGTARVNGETLRAGDAAAVEGEDVRLEGVDGAEVLLFDLA